MKGRSASKIKLTSYDELLGGGEETNDIPVSYTHLDVYKRQACGKARQRVSCVL